MRNTNPRESSTRGESNPQPKSSKQSNHKQLRILDYRNGKYQGFTSQPSLTKDGLGILIDDNYSFLMSEWKNNQVDGPFFMVYPDESILYGYIQKQKIGQIVCYEVNKEFNMILSKNTNIIVVDLLPSSSILVFKVDNKFLDQHTLESFLRRKQEKQVNNQIDTGIQLLSEEKYTSLDQKYKIYQKKLSLSNIPEYLKSYESFIRQKFNSTPQRNELIQIIKSRQDLSINFRTSAITLFLKLYLLTNQTKILGSMNRYENEYEFYRKIIHNSNSVEQFVTKTKNPYTAQYNLRPVIRPKRCAVELCNFHRSAVTYINQFLNLNYMYSIKDNLEKINQLINIYVTNKYAQIQLENSRYQAAAYDEEPNNKTKHINYTLQQVQQEIYDAIKRKRQSTGKKIYPGRSPSRINEYPQYQNRSNDKYTKSQIKNIDSASKNRNSPYIRALHYDDQIVESRLNRSKTSYLNISNVQKTDRKTTPTKNPSTKSINQNTASGKKYAYLDEDQIQTFDLPRNTKSIPRYEPYQNIRRLTQDYENIQREIQLSTPKDKKSPSPYKLDNSIYRKSTTKVYDYDPHNLSTSVKHVPLSQKKIFRYLPN